MSRYVKKSEFGATYIIDEAMGRRSISKLKGWSSGFHFDGFWTEKELREELPGIIDLLNQEIQ